MATQVTSLRRPKANRKNLIVEEAGGEVLVYNRENDHVHSLNDPAARIWKLCTGRRTVEQIAAELDMALAPAAREAVVKDAIAQFERVGLVEAADGAPANPSRRKWARRFGVGVAAGVAMPLVTSILAPSPVLAASGPCSPACVSPMKCCRCIQTCVHSCGDKNVCPCAPDCG